MLRLSSWNYRDEIEKVHLQLMEAEERLSELEQCIQETLEGLQRHEQNMQYLVGLVVLLCLAHLV